MKDRSKMRKHLKICLIAFATFGFSSSGRANDEICIRDTKIAADAYRIEANLCRGLPETDWFRCSEQVSTRLAATACVSGVAAMGRYQSFAMGFLGSLSRDRDSGKLSQAELERIGVPIFERYNQQMDVLSLEMRQQVRAMVNGILDNRATDRSLGRSDFYSRLIEGFGSARVQRDQGGTRVFTMTIGRQVSTCIETFNTIRCN